jgi:hypothetical protein
MAEPGEAHPQTLLVALEHECSTTSGCSTSINSPAPVRSLRPLGSWTVGVCGPNWGPPSFLEAAVACHTPEEWLPVEWLVPAEQTARNPPPHKCRSGCTRSAWTSPTPPHLQAGGSQTRSSPLGGRCVGFPGWYRCRCRGLSGHQHSPWTIISSPDRPDHAVVSLFERSSKTSDTVSAPPDLVCVGWTWRDRGGRHPGCVA